MKHKYKIAVFLLYCIFYLSFGEGRGEVFAQQLSPRNIIKPKISSSPNTYWPEQSVPTGRAGQLVGVTNMDSLDVAGNTWQIPYLYRQDSTGKFTSMKHYKFAGTINSYWFDKVIPSKDSLYIVGGLHDEQNLTDSHGNNMMIFKTDSAGNVQWKKKWGDANTYEDMTSPIVCADGGLAACANSDFQLNNSSGTDWYFAHKASIIKYNSNGTLIFNKAFQCDNVNPARGNIIFTTMAETPEKGFMIAGYATPDPTKYTYGSSTTTRETGLFLVKLDANGNKLWDKAFFYNYNNQFAKGLSAYDIIADPAGGYIIIGNAIIDEWDPKGSQYSFYDKKYYNEHQGGLIMKISEAGDIEWIKSIHHPLFKTYNYAGVSNYAITFNHITLSSVSPSGFVISGTIDIPNVSRPIHDSVSNTGGLHCCLGITKTLIVKTDLNGDLLWDREYGSLTNYWTGNGDYKKIYEEPGGTLILNSLASSDPADIAAFNNMQSLPFVGGILRLNSSGYLGDPSCSLSPKLLEYNVDKVVTSFDNISADYDPTAGGTIKAVGVFSGPVPSVTNGVCANPLLADFSYDVSCQGNGTMVKFTNGSMGASLFHFDFGDPTSSANISDSANVQHLYITGRTYSVTLKVWDLDSSKSNTIVKKIIVPGMRHITMHTPNSTVCQGSTVNLTTTINSGFFAPSTFTFGINKVATFDFAAAFTDSTFKTIPIDTTHSFFIYPGTCVTSDTIVVTVIPTVHMGVTGNKILCKGDSSLLMASGSKTYLWKPDNTVNDSLLVFPGKTTTYTVSSGQSSVCGTDTASIKVIVNAKPLGNISSEQTIFPGGQAHLLSSGGTTYLWSPSSGLNSVSIANPIAAPTQTTIYTVKITDANGCKSSDSVIVNVKYCGVDLFVPNAFSPNGDNENDILYVKTLNNNCIQSIIFKIFDRWGNKVFETNDINIGWNGVYRAKAMDADVFVYFLNAVIETGEVITQKGNITLMR